jgi:hypothetical protein
VNVLLAGAARAPDGLRLGGRFAVLGENAEGGASDIRLGGPDKCPWVNTGLLYATLARGVKYPPGVDTTALGLLTLVVLAGEVAG